MGARYRLEGRRHVDDLTSPPPEPRKRDCKRGEGGDPLASSPFVTRLHSSSSNSRLTRVKRKRVFHPYNNISIRQRNMCRVPKPSARPGSRARDDADPFVFSEVFFLGGVGSGRSWWRARARHTETRETCERRHIGRRSDRRSTFLRRNRESFTRGTRGGTRETPPWWGRRRIPTVRSEFALSDVDDDVERDALAATIRRERESGAR